MPNHAGRDIESKEEGQAKECAGGYYYIAYRITLHAI